MTETCSTCRWWADAFDVALRNGFVKLGNCEPYVMERRKGLTAGDYHCDEWLERIDDGYEVKEVDDAGD